MPVARRYGQLQVERAPLPGVRKTAAETALSEGAGVSAARADLSRTRAGVADQLAQRGLQETDAYFREERQKAIDLDVLGYDNALAKYEQTALYDPDKGAMQVRGKDATDNTQTVLDGFNAYAGELEAKLGTDDAKLRAAKIRSEREQNIRGTLLRHADQEVNAYRAAELDDTIKNATSAAAANAQDVRRVGVELDRITQAITTEAPRLGLGPEATQQALASARSNVHVSVIGNLLDNDQTSLAQAYFDEAKGEIEGTKLGAVEKALEQGKLTKAAQQKTDELLAEYTTLGQQREAAKEIDDPKLRDEVMQRLEHEAAIKDRADREQQEADALQAANIIEIRGRFDDIGPQLLSRLPRETRSGLMAYARAKAAGVPIDTDWKTYYSLIDQAGTDPETFTKANLLQYRGKLDDPEFKQLAEIQLAYRQGDAKKGAKTLGSYQTTSQVVNETLAEYKIDVTDKSIQDKVATLRNLVDAKYEEFKGDHKREPTNTEVSLMVRDVLGTPIDRPRSFLFWNLEPSHKTLSEEMATIADVPDDDRKRIIEALGRAQIKPTDPLILQVWLQAKTKGGGQ